MTAKTNKQTSESFPLLLPEKMAQGKMFLQEKKNPYLKFSVCKQTHWLVKMKTVPKASSSCMLKCKSSKGKKKLTNTKKKPQ